MTWRRPPAAWPVGQVDDRVKSLGKGRGRLHRQRFSDGSTRTHRDRYDPDQGLGEAALHLALETPLLLIGGAIFIVGGLVTVAVKAIREER